MRKIINFGIGTMKFLFAGLLLIGNFIMNCIGVLVCAITNQ